MNSKTEEIVNAGCELFMKYGIKSVSMDDLASHLAISKKTLYKYIKDKRHLVEMVVDSLLTKNKFHDRANTSQLNAIEEYFMIYQQVTKMISDANFSAEFDLQKYYPDLYKKMLDTRQKKMMFGIKKNLEKGVKEKFYRQDLDVDVIAKLNVLLGESMHDYEFLMKNKPVLLHIMEVNFDFYMHGVCSPEGLKEYYKNKEKTNIKS